MTLSDARFAEVALALGAAPPAGLPGYLRMSSRLACLYLKWMHRDGVPSALRGGARRYAPADPSAYRLSAGQLLALVPRLGGGWPFPAAAGWGHGMLADAAAGAAAAGLSPALAACPGGDPAAGLAGVARARDAWLLRLELMRALEAERARHLAMTREVAEALGGIPGMENLARLRETSDVDALHGELLAVISGHRARAPAAFPRAETPPHRRVPGAPACPGRPAKRRRAGAAGAMDRWRRAVRRLRRMGARRPLDFNACA